VRVPPPLRGRPDPGSTMDVGDSWLRIDVLTSIIDAIPINRAEIEFDIDKGAATLRERGLDFGDAAKVFAGRSITFEDRRRDYGEARWVTLGERMVVIAWTLRGHKRRIISMRRANEREQALYDPG
jgi:uncharacterized DUF497 family protein